MAVVTGKDNEEVKVHVRRDIVEVGVLLEGLGWFRRLEPQHCGGPFPLPQGDQSQIMHFGQEPVHMPRHVLWKTSIERS